MIAAVLFDLDDTLFPQEAWLDGAWRTVASQGAAFGVPPVALYIALRQIAAQGTDRGHIIDRALQCFERRDVPIAPLVELFRSHRPEALDVYPGVHDALAALAYYVPVGVVTDGDPFLQRAKVRALQLDVDVVVYSDDHGRDRRKPHPLPFRCALDALDVCAGDAVFVGDRPDKDILGAAAVGMRTIRVRTGEYAFAPDEPPAWRSVPSAIDAISFLCKEIRRAEEARRHPAPPRRRASGA